MQFFNWQENILQDNGWSSHINYQRYNRVQLRVEPLNTIPSPPVFPVWGVMARGRGLLLQTHWLSSDRQYTCTSSPSCKAWGGVWGGGAWVSRWRVVREGRKESENKASDSSKSSSITVWTFCCSLGSAVWGARSPSPDQLDISQENEPLRWSVLYRASGLRLLLHKIYIR